MSKSIQKKQKSNTAFILIVLAVLAAGGTWIWSAMRNARPTSIELAPGTELPTAQGYLLGDPNAPITIAEFADFECPGCGQFALVEEPDMRARIIDAGLANFRFFDMPLTSIHGNTLSAHLAASCANEQGKFWEYHDRLFRGQDEWNTQATSNPRKLFDAYAAELGLDTKSFKECFDSQRTLPQIQASAQMAAERGINGTPTFVINNRVYGNLGTTDQIKKIVDSLRATLPAAPAPAAPAAPDSTK